MNAQSPSCAARVGPRLERSSERAKVVDHTVGADSDHSTAGAVHTAAAADTSAGWDYSSAAEADMAPDWSSSQDRKSGCRTDHMNPGRRAALKNNPGCSRRLGRKNTQ